MIGRLLERLFVRVEADLSQLGGQLQAGVNQTKGVTQKMARQWQTVSSSIESLTQDLKRGVITQAQYMSQLNRHTSSIAALSGGYRVAQKQVMGYAASLRAAGTAQRVAVNPKIMNNFGRSVGMARMQVMNLGFQINDVGQTLATGMNPMTVLIQQGSQILQIYAGQGGVRAAFSDLSKILIGISKKIWPLLVLAAAIKGVQTEINKTSKVTVSWGNTALAVFQVVRDGIWGVIGPAVEKIAGWFQVAWNQAIKWTIIAIDGIINSVRILVRGIAISIDVIPGIFRAGFHNARAWVLESLSEMAYDVGQFLQGVADGFNAVFKTNLQTGDGLISLSATMSGMSKDARSAASGIKTLSDAWSDFQTEASEIWASSPLTDFFNAIKDQAVINALNNIAKGVDGVGGAAAKAAKEVETLMEMLGDKLTTAAENLAAVFGNAFERLAETGKFVFGDFIKELNKLIIKSVSEILQQELTDMFKRLATANGGLGGLISNLFTGLFGGGLVSGGTAVGGGGRARGGVAMPWRSFVAGEEGPELITQDGPSGARRVQTAGRTRANRETSGYSGPPVTIVVQTPDIESFRKSQGQIASRMSMFIARGTRNQ